jgi:two-component system phosphate regulon sensor histidine kinase PhoR
VLGGDLLAVAGVVAAGLGGFLIGRARSRPGDGEVAALAVEADYASDRRFEQLIREIGVGIVTVDGRGRIEAINPVAVEIFEMPVMRAVGRSMIEAVPSFELDRRVREALAGRPSRGQVPINVRQTARMLTVTVLPLEGADGALVIAIDDTRLHELEQTRRDFVSSVSHELRTPLSSINLMIETILSTDYDPEAIKMFLPRVKQEVDRMIHLVEDLLDLARSESGRLRLRTEELDLGAVAANILKTFEPRAAQQGVRLELDAQTARLDGDADRLAQVMVNLVDNALRHTPAGGTVGVDVRRIDGAALLTVRDTGVGIPFGDLPHVFERFYVVDRSRARDSAGTGLGLSIVKQIVEAHGGTISADSELGYGASFTCVFPALRAAGLAAPL